MDLNRDALLLVGHGSSHYDDAARAWHGHAAALQAAGHFARAGVGLLRGSPDVAETLRYLTDPVVHVVPCFIEPGYFSRVAVPSAIARAVSDLGRPGQALRMSQPVGLHPGLARLIEARVLACCPDPADWTVLLVGHGSRRSPGRSVAVRRHADSLAATGRFAAVRTAFLEEPPQVSDALAACRTRPVAVVGMFAGAGGHVREDLPRLVAEERRRRGARAAPVTEIGALADEADMRALILDLVRAGSG